MQLSQFLDSEVFPADFVAGGLIADAVNLERDDAGWSGGILEVGCLYAVDERLDVVALALDAGCIPFTVLKGFACGFVLFEVKNPSAPRLVVDACGVGARGRINFVLVPEDSVCLHFEGFAKELERSVFCEKLASELDSGVHSLGDFELEFEHEISVWALRAEERVARV